MLASTRRRLQVHSRHLLQPSQNGDSARAPAPAGASAREPVNETVDAVIVGMGFSGLCLTHKLRKLGLTLRSFEKGADVGGTWYWNRYPGAACDIESFQYSFSFSHELEQEWNWSRKYAQQPEILQYAKHVADRFDLRRDTFFNTEVRSAVYSEAERLWVVRTDQGDCVSAQFLLLANGALSAPAFSSISGMSEFDGVSFHTHDWDAAADLRGKRVGVIGTGSTATQCIPELAKVASRLYVFQRSPAWCAPRRDAATDPQEAARIKADYRSYRMTGSTQSGGNEGGNAGLAHVVSEAVAPGSVGPPPQVGGFAEALAEASVGVASGEGDTEAVLGPLNDPGLNRHLQRHLAAHIANVVSDPVVARALTPDYPVSCKRLCITDDYWPTFNLPNVELVDLQGKSIERVAKKGPVCPDGTVCELDVLVYATGFDALTGAAGTQLGTVQGKGGQTLAAKWSAGPSSYLGILTAGFPNMFILVGPQSASVLSNMVNAIEHQVSYISGVIRDMRRRRVSTVDVDLAAERDWVQHCVEQTKQTIWGGLGGGCRSWYNKANLATPGDRHGTAEAATVLPYTGGFIKYVEQVSARKFSGLVFS